MNPKRVGFLDFSVSSASSTCLGISVVSLLFGASFGVDPFVSVEKCRPAKGLDLNVGSEPSRLTNAIAPVCMFVFISPKSRYVISQNFMLKIVNFAEVYYQ